MAYPGDTPQMQITGVGWGQPDLGTQG
jgi:hypothetical protein